MENLRALVYKVDLTSYQIALAQREFEGIIESIKLYEQAIKKNAVLPHISGSLLDRSIELFDMLSDGERIIVMDGYCKGCGKKQDGGICSCVDF